MRFNRSFALPLIAFSLVSTIAIGGRERPKEYDVSFDVTDFETKPWMKEFEYVVVVNRANEGADKQSIRVYHNQQLVAFEEIQSYLNEVHEHQRAEGSDDRNRKDRLERIAELGKKQWAPGVFKVSTGRNEFEAKGEHHSRKDSWSVTPTGYYVPQHFTPRHKSESYSSKHCGSFFGKLAKAVTRKQLCTYMDNVVFFNGGIALHKAIPGTESVLGKKASGGCVRLPAALSEFLYLNINQAKNGAMPVVNPDGTVKTDESGNVVRAEVNKSVWGSLTARGALIIVQDKVL